MKVISHVSSPGMINLALGGCLRVPLCLFQTSEYTFLSDSVVEIIAGSQDMLFQYILGYVVLTILDP